MISGLYQQFHEFIDNFLILQVIDAQGLDSRPFLGGREMRFRRATRLYNTISASPMITTWAGYLQFLLPFPVGKFYGNARPGNNRFDTTRIKARGCHDSAAK